MFGKYVDNKTKKKKERKRKKERRKLGRWKVK